MVQTAGRSCGLWTHTDLLNVRMWNEREAFIIDHTHHLFIHLCLSVCKHVCDPLSQSLCVSVCVCVGQSVCAASLNYFTHTHTHILTQTAVQSQFAHFASMHVKDIDPVSPNG